MSTMLANLDTRVVQDSSLDEYAAHPYAGGHMSAVVMMLLSVVAIVGSLLADVMLPAAVGPSLIVMAVLMTGAAGLCMFSLFATGKIIEARFDPTRRRAHLLYRGAVAHTEWTLPLDRISTARMAMGYDARGQKLARPTLELTNGRTLLLPEATTFADLEDIRAMLEPPSGQMSDAWMRKTNARSQSHVRRHKSG